MSFYVRLDVLGKSTVRRGAKAYLKSRPNRVGGSSSGCATADIYREIPNTKPRFQTSDAFAYSLYVNSVPIVGLTRNGTAITRRIFSLDAMNTLGNFAVMRAARPLLDPGGGRPVVRFSHQLDANLPAPSCSPAHN
jgi:hypothetical protein